MIRRSLTQGASIEGRLRRGRRRFERSRSGYVRRSGKKCVAANEAVPGRSAPEMSSARPAGCAPRRLATRRGRSRRSWAAGIGTLMRRANRTPAVIEHLADDDAAPVIDETGFPTGQSIVRRSTQIHLYGRKDDEPPDRSVRDLLSRHVMRLSIAPVSSEGINRRSRSSGGRLRACRCRLCDQTKACEENDGRAMAASVPFQVGRRRDGLRRRRHRTATTSGRQGLRAPGQQRSCVLTLGKTAAGRGYAGRYRPDAASSDWRRCRREPEPRDRGRTTGVISNGPISRPNNSTVQMMVCGHAGY